MLQGLSVKLSTVRANAGGWIETSVSGEDETVALRYLADNVGFCLTNMKEMGKFSTCKGYLKDPAKSKNELWVDIGALYPTRLDPAIPLLTLQSQLGDGRKIALNKLAELFGFCRNLPLHVRITQIDLEEQRIEAELSNPQQKQFADWTRLLLDRLLILGTSQSEVRNAVRVTESMRDVVGIESLGMFEHSLVCKLGTDAAGLIPRIGRILKKSAFSVFSPRRILEFFGNDSALFTS